MSFGRKGLQAGAAIPARPGGIGQAAATNQPSEDDMAAKRAAFIASERARKNSEVYKEASLSADPMAHLRNGQRPAAPLSGGEWTGHNQGSSEQPKWSPSAQAARVAERRSPSVSYSKIFGHPDQRSLVLAYVYWYFGGLLSIHRIYCGNLEGAMYQFGLFVLSLVCLAIYSPIGVAGCLAWLMWLIADLFTMPGMMRRFRALCHEDRTSIFA